MKKILAALLAFTLALTLVACGSSSSSDDTSTDTSGDTASEDTSDDDTSTGTVPTTVTVGTANSLGTFLLDDNNGDCYTGIYLVFDSLFSFDPDTKEAYSDVLSDWYYGDDGLSLTMTINEGIYFSNGVEATAEDVLFSIQNFVDREANTAPFFNAYDFDNAEFSDDNLTVTIPLTSEFSPSITEVGNLPLLCKSWSEEVGYDSEEWISSPVGSGPYEVSEYVTDSHVTLTLRDDYWGTYDSGVETFIINYYGEPATMYIDLENGDIDLALELLETDYNRGLEGEENIAVDLILAGENRLLSLDSNCEALQDENVRLAIAYGVNWEDVSEAGYGDMCGVATSLIISSSEYYTDVGAYEYDPEYAIELLEEAGYGDGLTLTMISTDEDDQVKMTTSLQYYLSEIGITLETQNLDFPSALAAWLAGGESDLLWQDSSRGSIISEPYASLRATSRNNSGIPGVIIEDDTYNELLDAATYTSDTEVRAENFAELQQYVKDTALVIPVAEESVAIAWRTDVISSVNILNGTDANLRNIEFAQ